MTTIERFARLQARLVLHDWTWATANREFIEANWARRLACTPKLFNGRVLMIAATRPIGERLELDFFAADYADLLGHIDAGFPDASVRNGFAMGALRSHDGAFLLGVMGQHTANAGRLYFPAGTPDLTDVRPDDTIDLEGSILREIVEETGLRVDPSCLGPSWSLVQEGGRTALMRAVQVDRTAEELRADILAHLGRDPEPELADIVVLSRPDEIEPDRMPGFLPAYLRAAFAEP